MLWGWRGSPQRVEADCRSCFTVVAVVFVGPAGEEVFETETGIETTVPVATLALTVVAVLSVTVCVGGVTPKGDDTDATDATGKEGPEENSPLSHISASALSLNIFPS